MQPSQPHTPTGPGPQPPYHPPEYTVGSNVGSPRQPFSTNGIQQHESGHYEVLPPLQTAPNDGHTGHNPYEFIVNPAKPPKKPMFGTGKSFLMQIAFIGGGLVVLLIIAAIVISALAPKGSAPGMTAVAQRQEEIIRIADDASIRATGQDTKNFAANVSASVTSSQLQITGYLGQHGTKLTAKILALDQNAQTDTLLDTAASANNYDNAVVQNLTDQLTTYETLLSTTYKQASGPTAKQVLQGCFSSADLLGKQAKALSSVSGS